MYEILRLGKSFGKCLKLACSWVLINKNYREVPRDVKSRISAKSFLIFKKDGFIYVITGVIFATLYIFRTPLPAVPLYFPEKI